MTQQRRILSPEQRAENLARFLTKRLRYKGWCKSVNTDTIDIRYTGTCAATQATGQRDFPAACKMLRIRPTDDIVLEIGLLPYASYINEPDAWQAEAAALNAAITAMVTARQENYKRPRPRLRRKLSRQKKWISPQG